LPTKKVKDKKPGDKETGDKNLGPKKDGDDDEDEPRFMPRLGGPRPKLDPRFDKKRRPMKKGDKEKGDDKDMDDAKRGDLDAAEKSLESDANTLEAMIEGLMNPGKGKQGKPQEGAESEAAAMARQLREMLESAQTREARMMAAAAKGLAQGMQKGQKGQQQKGPNMTAQATEGNLTGGESPASDQAGLGKLDPATRAMILKLPPSRFRDELVQGLNERGPEAYEAFIQDYFKRLTDSKTPPK
jgi:hypothetical protein